MHYHWQCNEIFSFFFLPLCVTTEQNRTSAAVAARSKRGKIVEKMLFLCRGSVYAGNRGRNLSCESHLSLIKMKMSLKSHKDTTKERRKIINRTEGRKAVRNEDFFPFLCQSNFPKINSQLLSFLPSFLSHSHRQFEFFSIREEK